MKPGKRSTSSPGLHCRRTKSSGPSPASFAVADLDLAFSGYLVRKKKKKSMKVVEMVRPRVFLFFTIWKGRAVRGGHRVNGSDRMIY